MDKKYDVFISYRRVGGYELAEKVRDMLTERGISCYMDLEEGHAGRFDTALLTAINNSTNFILVLSKDAMDRCKNDDDWVRAEVMEAIRLGKNIVTVRSLDFKWKKSWNEALPPEMRLLNNYNGAIVIADYYPCVIAKLIGYLENVSPKDPVISKPSLYLESSRFLAENARNMKNLQSVDMAFHAGGEWHRNTDMVEALSKLLEMGCKVRVIINTTQAVESVCSHMRQPRKKYVTFEENREDWASLARENSDLLEVRELDFPLLHRLYIVRGEHDGCANVKYYSYGNYTPEKDFRLSFAAGDPSYRLYAEEFEYLWQKAKDVLA